MKNFLFIMAAALLLVSCSEKRPEGYADAGIARRALQISIYETTMDAEYKGFIEEEDDSATVETLRKEAEEIDSLIVSCLIIEDCAQDTIINMYDIK